MMVRNLRVSAFVLVCACAVESEPPAAPNDDSAALALVAPACNLRQIISAEELGASERAAFTSSGRLFVIGVPRGAPLGSSAIVELVREGAGYALRPYVAGTLEGTRDGSIGGAPAGAPCSFTGLTVDDEILYAACGTIDGYAALLQVDTELDRVRAAMFTGCNAAPRAARCDPVPIFANGAAVDEKGRVYVSDMLVHQRLGSPARAPSIVQIEIGKAPDDDASRLNFRHRAFVTKNLALDSIAPNGVQIRDQQLYYAAGANVNVVPIRPDGSAGPVRVHYRGPAISYIDDFALGEGELLLARVLPSAIVTLDDRGGTPYERASCAMPALGPASSLTYQPEHGDDSLFAPGTVVVTQYFGGGLSILEPVE